MACAARRASRRAEPALSAPSSSSSRWNGSHIKLPFAAVRAASSKVQISAPAPLPAKVRAQYRAFTRSTRCSTAVRHPAAFVSSTRQPQLPVSTSRTLVEVSRTVPAGAPNRARFPNSVDSDTDFASIGRGKCERGRDPQFGATERHSDPPKPSGQRGFSRENSSRMESSNFAFGRRRSGIRSAPSLADRRKRGDCVAWPLLPCFRLPIPPRPCCIDQV